MNKTSGLEIFSAAACLALAGCLAADQEPSEAQRLKEAQVAFIRTTSATVLKAASISAEPGMSPDAIKEAIDKLGCPRLSSLVEDLIADDFQSTEEQPLPKSFTQYLDCFGISASPTPDDVDVVWEKLGNGQQLLDCVCGGSGLSDAATRLATRAFSAELSAAASTYFDVSKSSAASSGFDASGSSAAGGGFNPSQSKSAGHGFSPD